MNALSRLNLDWAIRCFGTKHVYDPKVRALRIVEEAVELAQAVGVDIKKINACVHQVYQKDRGNVLQEVEGVVMTTACFAAAHLIMDLDDVLLGAMRIALEKPPEYYGERNKKKEEMGLT